MQKEAFEATGLIPRSIIRTFERFLQQLLPGSETIAIREYRLSRYQIRVSIKSLFQLICIPLLVNYTVKPFLVKPIVQYVWDSRQQQLFLNHDQQKQAFRELHNFSETLFFDALLQDTHTDTGSKQFYTETSFTCSPQSLTGQCKALINQTDTSSILLFSPSSPHTSVNSFHVSHPSLDSPFQQLRDPLPLAKEKVNKGKASLCQAKAPYGNIESMEYRIAEIHRGNEIMGLQERGNQLLEKQSPFYPENLEGLETKKAYQLKSLEIAQRYNTQSILAITNVFGDLLTFVTVSLLFVLMRAQIIILQSFVTEFIYSLSDTSKSFLLILGMDLLVGFHSPRAWELSLQALLAHVGLPENENFILLFVALFPVFLDTVFKYWIFRYLNKISPSTVVTYHSMLE